MDILIRNGVQVFNTALCLGAIYLCCTMIHMYLLVMCDNFSIHIVKLVSDLNDSQRECDENTTAKIYGFPGS